MNDNHIKLMGYIKKFAKDCPKPDGWFSCRFKCFSGEEVSLTGKTDYGLSVGVQLVVIAYKEFRNGYENYKAIEIKPDINSRKGLIAYLSSSIFVGIGKVTAGKIYDAVGPDFIDIVKTDPDYLKKFGFNDSIIDSLVKGVSHNSLYTDLVEKYPCFKPAEYNAIIDKYSSDAISILMENPYRLLYDFNKDEDDISFDFKSVDKFALYIGSNIDVNIRLKEAVRYYVAKEVDNNKGSYIDIADNDVYDKLLNGIYDLLNGSVSIYDIKPFVDNIRNHDGLVLECFYDDGCHAFLFDKTDYKIEKKLADNIKDMLDSDSLIKMDDEDIDECITEFEDIYDTVLDDVQKDAVKMALNNRFSVITGGPGRGKTTIIECITFCISFCEIFIPNKSILLAPTGKAVSKLREVADWFCDEPLTIDRFLLSDILGVYNGDTGVIIDYDTGSSENETSVTVHFDNGSDVVFHRGDYDDLKLAYVLSVHKSQGSEYKVVLIYVPNLSYLFESHADFLSKNMLYTGVTRAKNVVHLIGHSETIGGMIANKLPKRPTALNYFLNGEI